MAKKCGKLSYKDYSRLRTLTALKEPPQNTGNQQTGNGNNNGEKQYTDELNPWGNFNSGRVSEFDKDRTPDAAGASLASIKWFQDNMGMSYAEAKDAAEAFLYWSHHGDEDAHLNIGKGVHTNDILDRVIEAKNAFVYTGVQDRGLSITPLGLKKMGITGMSPYQYVKNILKSGIWKEPGATSFGTQGEEAAKGWANYFSNKGTNNVSVVVEYVGGKTGFPMDHLSYYHGEREALHSRSEMTGGMKIIGSKWEGKNYVLIRVTDRKR